MKFLIYFLSFLLFSTNILAKNWQIDEKNSKIEFSGAHIGNKFEGKFEKFTGEIFFDENNLEKSFAKIKIDLNSAKTGNKSYDSTLPQTDWFKTKKQQFANFETSKITKIANQKYKIEGFLDINQIKKPHIFEAQIKISKNKANLTAKSVITRLDFNIGKQSDPTGDWVSLEIPLNIEVNALVVKN